MIVYHPENRCVLWSKSLCTVVEIAAYCGQNGCALWRDVVRMIVYVAWCNEDATKKLEIDLLFRRCWICDETDKPAQLTVRCGCVDRMAHQLCLTEW